MAAIKCLVCGRAITNALVETVKGPMHGRCWRSSQTFDEVQSFKEFLSCEVDATLVKNLLLLHVPEKLQKEIIRNFNTTRRRRGGK